MSRRFFFFFLVFFLVDGDLRLYWMMRWVEKDGKKLVGDIWDDDTSEGESWKDEMDARLKVTILV